MLDLLIWQPEYDGVHNSYNHRKKGAGMILRSGSVTLVLGLFFQKREKRSEKFGDLKNLSFLSCLNSFLSFYSLSALKYLKDYHRFRISQQGLFLGFGNYMVLFQAIRSRNTFISISFLLSHCLTNSKRNVSSC